MKYRPQKHLLIGGPGTGKSSTLNYLSDLGYYCLPEIAREITLAAKEKGVDQLYLTDPLAFSKALLDGRIQQFKKAGEVNENVVYLDRGIPDVSAYLNYSNQFYPDKFNKMNTKYTYDKVFHFPIWDEIFINDNERYENLDEAKKIDDYLQKTYLDLGYQLINVPKLSIKQRANFIIQHQI